MTLINSLIDSNRNRYSFKCIYNYAICEYGKFYFFFSMFISFISFSCFVSRLNKVMMTGIPDLRGKAFTISSSVVFVVGFKNIPFIKSRKFLSLPTFIEL